jgi:hypothetical protein
MQPDADNNRITKIFGKKDFWAILLILQLVILFLLSRLYTDGSFTLPVYVMLFSSLVTGLLQCIDRSTCYLTLPAGR